MGARHVFVAGLTVFAVVAAVVCTHRQDQRRAEFTRLESNRLIAQIEAGKQELNARYGLTLLPLIETVPPAIRAQQFNWRKFSLTQRKAILKQLFNHVTMVERVFTLESEEGIRLQGGIDQLNRSRDTAWLFYLSGKKFESKLATARARRSKRA